MRTRGHIRHLGQVTVYEDGTRRISDWHFEGGGPGLDHARGIIGGWTADELAAIAEARDRLGDEKALAMAQAMRGEPT